MTKNLKLNLLILITFTSVLSSCGQTSNSKNKSTNKIAVKNYFDTRDQILFKLYKKTTNGLSYWETWNNDDKTAVVHWGLLGSYGEQRPVTTQNITILKDTINSLIAEKIKEGFAEVSYDLIK